MIVICLSARKQGGKDSVARFLKANVRLLWPSVTQYDQNGYESGHRIEWTT